VTKPETIRRRITDKYHGQSMASDRALIEMSKTMDLNAIAKKFGRTPESILKTAMRLGIAIKGRKAKAK
jgi:hypothetical protein